MSQSHIRRPTLSFIDERLVKASQPESQNVFKSIYFVRNKTILLCSLTFLPDMKALLKSILSLLHYMELFSCFFTFTESFWTFFHCPWKIRSATGCNLRDDGLTEQTCWWDTVHDSSVLKSTDSHWGRFIKCSNILNWSFLCIDLLTKIHPDRVQKNSILVIIQTFGLNNYIVSAFYIIVLSCSIRLLPDCFSLKCDSESKETLSGWERDTKITHCSGL